MGRNGNLSNNGEATRGDYQKYGWLFGAR